MTVFVTKQQELETLEDCIGSCKLQLDYFREQQQYLQADLAEADLNAMLEKHADLRMEIACTD